MLLELGLMALACLLTHRVIPQSQLIFPALGIISAMFFSDSLYQFILIGFSCFLWILAQRE
jgi:hypothetical protein